MAQISEVDESDAGIASTLRTGLDTLDLDQEVTFQAYSRVVLPLDGYVFWNPTTTLCVKGSLHFPQVIEQSEDETVGVADMLFTSEQQIVEFSGANDTIYVAKQGELRYAFSRQEGFFRAANLWHYAGRSVYPAMAPQLLDNPGMIDPKRAIVSNSLPLWLALSRYKPVYGFTPNLQLYPSFLVDANLAPPYGAVHIEGPEPLQAVPLIDSESSSWQLVADRVRVTLYGLQSNESIDFMNAVLQYSRDTQNFGLMSMPAVVDGKRTQQELQAIAMQKVLEFRISYYQSRVNTVARKLILSAVPTIVLNG